MLISKVPTNYINSAEEKNLSFKAIYNSHDLFLLLFARALSLYIHSYVGIMHILIIYTFMYISIYLIYLVFSGGSHSIILNALFNQSTTVPLGSFSFFHYYVLQLQIIVWTISLGLFLHDTFSRVTLTV